MVHCVWTRQRQPRPSIHQSKKLDFDQRWATQYENCLGFWYKLSGKNKRTFWYKTGYMCDYHCSPNTLYNLSKITKAILLDLITLAFVLEYVQWQPRIQRLTQKCKPNSRKRYLFETNLHITNSFNSLILTNEKSYLEQLVASLINSKEKYTS